MPSCAYWLPPQHQALLSAATPQAWSAPALTWMKDRGTVVAATAGAGAVSGSVADGTSSRQPTTAARSNAATRRLGGFMRTGWHPGVKQVSRGGRGGAAGAHPSLVPTSSALSAFICGPKLAA